MHLPRSPGPNSPATRRLSRACPPRRPEGARARATSDFSARPGRATRIARRHGALAPARRTDPSASREPSTAVSGRTVSRLSSVPRGGKVACATRTETREDVRRARARGTTRYAPVHDPRVRAEPVAPRSNLASRARGRARARSPRRSRFLTHQPLDSLDAQARLGTRWLGLMGPPRARPMRRTRRLRAPVSSRRRNPPARACFPIQRAIRAC